MDRVEAMAVDKLVKDRGPNADLYAARLAEQAEREGKADEAALWRPAEHSAEAADALSALVSQALRSQNREAFDGTSFLSRLLEPHIHVEAFTE
jgi:hypothetical protein